MSWTNHVHQPRTSERCWRIGRIKLHCSQYGWVQCSMVEKKPGSSNWSSYSEFQRSINIERQTNQIDTRWKYIHFARELNCCLNNSRIWFYGYFFFYQISNIEFADTAIYECQAIATPSDKFTALVELLVKHAPKVDNIEITPSPVAVNSTAQLKCLASGYPRPSIIWRRENDAILPAGGNSFA